MKIKNLHYGDVFTYHEHPFVYFEIDQLFDLEQHCLIVFPLGQERKVGNLKIQFLYDKINLSNMIEKYLTERENGGILYWDIQSFKRKKA